MENLNFFGMLNSTEVRTFTMNSETVNKIKTDLLPYSTAVELTVKNLDEMLGLKVSITNPGKEPVSYELGIDPMFLDATLFAAYGQNEKLKAYDPTNRQIEKGVELRTDILNQLLVSKLPVYAQIKEMEKDTSIIEVCFQLGYRRKMKIYFSGNDQNIIDKLKSAGLLEEQHN